MRRNYRLSDASLYPSSQKPEASSIDVGQDGFCYDSSPFRTKPGQPEEKTVITIVRGEIMGGERLASRLGAAESAHAVERCLKRVERVADGFRGRLLRSGNGQITIAFSSPEEACQGAIDMQRRVTALPPVSGVKLNIRLGVHGAQTEEQASLIAAQLLELALPEQILCCRELLLDVAHNIGVRVRDLQQLELSGGEAFQVMELIWHDIADDEMPSTLTSTSLLALDEISRADFEAANHAAEEAGAAGKLCVRYRGRAFLLDDRTPFITLGREHSNDLVIDDCKASRQHARIERKDGRYVLVDMSTNGTFITQAGEPEVFLRRESMPLRRRGTLCFGVSLRDPNAEKAEFELI